MDYAILQWIRETLWNGVTCAFFPFVSTLGNGAPSGSQSPPSCCASDPRAARERS